MFWFYSARGRFDQPFIIGRAYFFCRRQIYRSADSMHVNRRYYGLWWCRRGPRPQQQQQQRLLIDSRNRFALVWRPLVTAPFVLLGNQCCLGDRLFDVLLRYGLPDPSCHAQFGRYNDHAPRRLPISLRSRRPIISRAKSNCPATRWRAGNGCVLAGSGRAHDYLSRTFERENCELSNPLRS